MSEYIVKVNGQIPDAVYENALEQLVRCRDCAFAFRVDWPESCDVPPEFLNCQGPLVSLWDYERDEPKDNPVEPDGFCSWGKRRSE